MAVGRFEEWLRRAGLELEVCRFPEGTRTAEEAARAIGCRVEQIVKSLVFVADGQPLLVLVSGANRVDPAKLGALLGAPAKKADADMVRRVTGYPIGGVPPFGHAARLPAYLDQDLLRHPVVWAAAGRPDACFPISPKRLRELAAATPAELA